MRICLFLFLVDSGGRYLRHEQKETAPRLPYSFHERCGGGGFTKRQIPQ